MRQYSSKYQGCIDKYSIQIDVWVDIPAVCIFIFILSLVVLQLRSIISWIANELCYINALSRSFHDLQCQPRSFRLRCFRGRLFVSSNCSNYLTSKRILIFLQLPLYASLIYLYHCHWKLGCRFPTTFRNCADQPHYLS